ncbi:adenosylmethionine decarboxylase [Solihabitans fulvus]|uniref:S-adenosylmethionine decarboxylase proenzyme n=1 Tax=Solihabitans fulvus TaxID=1892852 RepID=A0A5B2X6H3_9PSEU|nr:adenosylmethionine decarboxylase [Solihabitans fulvus]KAA2258844.1 adenosylmethionine decarboxylase [Solihabitans fulvus]
MSEALGTAPEVGLFAGRHVMAELAGVDEELLNDEQFLRSTLERVLGQADATVCEVISKRFDPQGVTVLALLSESHASVHTYPEIGSVFVDAFTCGNRADPELAVRLLASELGATTTRVETIRRGWDFPPIPLTEKEKTG